MLVLFVVIAVFAFLNSPFFRVRDVQVRGSEYLSAQEIRLIADVPPESNIFLVPTRAIERRLLATPRISSARVARVLPDSVVITVTEKKTVAYLPYAGFFIELDKSGCAIAVSEAVTDPDTPVIVGVVPAYVAVGEPVRPGELVQIGAAVGAALMERRIPNLSEVDVSRADDVVLRTADGIKVFLGRSDGIQARVRLLDSILASIREQGLSVNYIDLRVEAKPVIREK
jgi:cell division protein FtsQ